MSVAPRDARYTLALLTAVYALGYADRNIINLLLDPIKQEYQLSDTIMGLITGFGFTAFQTLLGIPLARLADTSRRVTVLIVGLLMWSVMTGLSGLATSAILLAIARMGVGVGEACLTGPAHALLSSNFEKAERPRAFSIMGAGGEIGVILAFLVGGWVSHIWGWRAAFFVAGLPGIVLAVIMHLTLKEPPRGETIDRLPALPFGAALAELAQRPSFVIAVLASMAMGLNIFGIQVWSPSYLRRIYALDTASVGTTIALLRAGLSVTGAVAGGSIATWCVRRYGQRWFMLFPACICGVSGLALLAFLFAPSLAVAIVCLGLVNMTIGAQLGPVFSLIQTVSPIRSRALAAALFVSLTQLFGMGLGALAIGATSDALHASHGEAALRYALLIPAAGALLACLLYAFGARYVAHDIERAESAVS
ncbi:spinster family MFS transporter [Sphingomonas sp. Leaf339]|uniref:spinster family MFS transporter n=1 Tax=Sphingomonas sp. Leaf339 TaxID=1736343 RepID=UPI0009EB870B|nr:MFS transporter [Sphingomonas sp. Leaf339]